MMQFTSRERETTLEPHDWQRVIDNAGGLQ